MNKLSVSLFAACAAVCSLCAAEGLCAGAEPGRCGRL